MTNKLPWPDEYKKLFIEGGNYYEFAHFGWGSFDTQFRGYIRGYKESADLIIENAISSQRIGTVDTAVFPAFFLYRQFIELSLKEFILYFYEGTKEEKITKLSRLNHNLRRMWQEFSKIMPEAEDEEQRNTNEVVEKYIFEFAELDKSSFNFRYPITKNMDLIFQEEKRINLRHVQNIMEELSNFFSGVSDHLYEMRQYQEYGQF